MKVIFAPASRRNLEKIRKYIAKQSGNQDVADRFILRIIGACLKLDYIGPSIQRYRYAPDWHMLPFENYLILFKIRNDEIRVGQIRHSARMPFRR